MVGRSLVVLLVGVVALVTAPMMTVSADPWFTELRAWDISGPLPVSHPLLLAPDEDYDRYYFAMEARSGGYTIGHVTIVHAATGDTICEGPVADAQAGVLRRCDLRIGHAYIVQAKVLLPGTLILKAADETI